MVCSSVYRFPRRAGHRRARGVQSGPRIRGLHAGFPHPDDQLHVFLQKGLDSFTLLCIPPASPLPAT